MGVWTLTATLGQNMLISMSMNVHIHTIQTKKPPIISDEYISDIHGTVWLHVWHAFWCPRTFDLSLSLTIWFVSLELEMEANLPLEKTLRLSSEEAKYCIYMMEKYGEDYKVGCRSRACNTTRSPVVFTW